MTAFDGHEPGTTTHHDDGPPHPADDPQLHDYAPDDHDDHHHDAEPATTAPAAEPRFDIGPDHIRTPQHRLLEQHLAGPARDTTQLVAPQNPEAEEAILGALLLTGAYGHEDARQLADRIRDTGLQAGDFYAPSRAIIYAACLRLIDQGVAPDPILLQQELERTQQLKAAGGVIRIAELALLATSTANAPHHALLVVDCARRRLAITTSLQLMEAAYAGTIDQRPDLRTNLDTLYNTGHHNPTAGHQLVDGATFIADGADTVPSLWGPSTRGVLWARGESLLIAGPPGVGKSTLVQQLVLARMGIRTNACGWPVEPDPRPVLYLASDRPAQIRRSLARMVNHHDHPILAERLRVWKGPPGKLWDSPEGPAWMLGLAQSVGAGTVIVDSIKDMAAALSKDEAALGFARTCNTLLAAGIELVALHHQRKGQPGSGPPKALDDLFGSAMIGASFGSVALLWGEAGDPVVELRHLKQPLDDVGPLKLVHDHDLGTTSVLVEGVTLEDMLRTAGTRGLTVEAAANLLFGSIEPNDVEKARKRLKRAEEAGHALRIPATDTQPVTWVYDGPARPGRYSS